MNFKQYISLNEELDRSNITRLSDEQFYNLVKQGTKVNNRYLWTASRQEYIMNNHPKDFTLIPAKYMRKPILAKYRNQIFGGLFK